MNQLIFPIIMSGRLKHSLHDPHMTQACYSETLADFMLVWSKMCNLNEDNSVSIAVCGVYGITVLSMDFIIHSVCVVPLCVQSVSFFMCIVIYLFCSHLSNSAQHSTTAHICECVCACVDMYVSRTDTHISPYSHACKCRIITSECVNTIRV